MGLKSSKYPDFFEFRSPDNFVECDVTSHNVDIYDILDLLNPGDLIEVKRGLYSHWLICEKKILDWSANPFPVCAWCFHVTKSEDNKAILKYESLEEILKDTDGKNPTLCQINNQEDIAIKKTLFKPLPDLDKVFKYLHQLRDQTLDYDLKTFNCEHYCTLWKYGIPWSKQTEEPEKGTLIDWLRNIVSLKSSSSGKDRRLMYSQSILQSQIERIIKEFEDNVMKLN